MNIVIVRIMKQSLLANWRSRIREFC